MDRLAAEVDVLVVRVRRHADDLATGSGVDSTLDARVVDGDVDVAAVAGIVRTVAVLIDPVVGDLGCAGEDVVSDVVAVAVCCGVPIAVPIVGGTRVDHDIVEGGVRRATVLARRAPDLRDGAVGLESAPLGYGLDQLAVHVDAGVRTVGHARDLVPLTVRKRIGPHLGRAGLQVAHGLVGRIDVDHVSVARRSRRDLGDHGIVVQLAGAVEADPELDGQLVGDVVEARIVGYLDLRSRAIEQERETRVSRLPDPAGHVAVVSVDRGIVRGDPGALLELPVAEEQRIAAQGVRAIAVLVDPVLAFGGGILDVAGPGGRVAIVTIPIAGIESIPVPVVEVEGGVGVVAVETDRGPIAIPIRFVLGRGEAVVIQPVAGVLALARVDRRVRVVAVPVADHPAVAVGVRFVHAG